MREGGRPVQTYIFPVVFPSSRVPLAGRCGGFEILMSNARLACTRRHGEPARRRRRTLDFKLTELPTTRGHSGPILDRRCRGPIASAPRDVDSQL